MTSTSERYRSTASQSAGTVEKIADFWTQGSQKLTDYVPSGLPQVDIVPFVERYFEFVQRTVDISREFTVKWAESAGMLSGVVREQADQAELSDQLDKRDLPKTGNVDELIERLVEADSK
jgi:hypothetical protein